MSDGPYRSLPMASYWKRTARLAESDASDPADISAAFIRALAKEALECDISFCIDKASIIKGSLSLFSEYSLESLRNLAPGYPLINLFLDSFIHMKSSCTIKEKISKSLNAALVERSERAIRQMREHYLRNTTPAKARQTLGRLVRALKNEGFVDLANRLIENNLKSILSQKSRSGINDGVRL